MCKTGLKAQRLVLIICHTMNFALNLRSGRVGRGVGLGLKRERERELREEGGGVGGGGIEEE